MKTWGRKTPHRRRSFTTNFTAEVVALVRQPGARLRSPRVLRRIGWPTRRHTAVVRRIHALLGDARLDRRRGRVAELTCTRRSIAPSARTFKARSPGTGHASQTSYRASMAANRFSVWALALGAAILVAGCSSGGGKLGGSDDPEHQVSDLRAGKDQPCHERHQRADGAHHRVECPVLRVRTRRTTDTRRVAAAALQLRADTNLLRTRVGDKSSSYHPVQRSFLLIFANDVQQVDVQDTCGVERNGAVAATPTTTWIHELMRFTSPAPRAA